jgi:excisionase family DNA binding protein
MADDLRDGLGEGSVARSRGQEPRLQHLLTVRQVAERLGIHEKTLRRWATSGRFPCVRIRSRIRFDLQDVLKWISARKEGV